MDGLKSGEGFVDAVENNVMQDLNPFISRTSDSPMPRASSSSIHMRISSRLMDD